jgi:hypothetical protein
MKRVSSAKRDLFSGNIPNTGRQPELDMARGVAVLAMVLVHVFAFTGNDGTLNGAVGTLIFFFGGPPAAVVFMFLMGVGIVYSRRGSPKGLIKRGLKLIVAGYILSVFRYFLPILLGMELGIFPENLLGQLPYFTLPHRNLLEILLEIDVLHFAGFAMMFIGLLKKSRHFFTYCLALLFVIPVVSPWLWGICTGIAPVDFFLDYLWGSKDYIRFVFFPWISYPLLGVLFAALLKQVADKKGLYRRMFELGLLVLILTVVLFYLLKPEFLDFTSISSEEIEHYYYRHGLEGVVGISAFICLWIPLMYLFSSWLPEVIARRIQFWSRNVTGIYFTHYIILGWSLLIIGFNSFDIVAVIGFATAVMFCADRISVVLEGRNLNSI